jgi:hypothetical protein
MTTWYRPGGPTALVGAGTLLLIEAGPDDAMVDQLWPLDAGGAPVDAVLGALAAGGLAGLPDFGLVSWTPDSPVITVVVRGEVVAQLHGAGAAEVTARQVTTWAEARYERPDAVSLALPGDPHTRQLPVVAGVVSAAAVHHDFSGRHDLTPPAALAEAGPMADAMPEPMPDPTPHEGLVPVGTAPMAAPMHASMPHDGPAMMLGGVVHGPATDLLSAYPPPPAPAPSMAPVVVEPSEPEPADEAEDESDDEVEDDELPEVLAAYCPNGHPNPPHGATCRVCGEPVTVQEPVAVPRPVVGVLRFDTGPVVPLQRGVVIGRNPRAEEQLGGELPELVPVPSPEQNVSRSHLRVDIHGWEVVVTDLGSQNGSEITLPGQAPQRLAAGEPVAIPLGTRVGLAGEVFFGYEPAS